MRAQVFTFVNIAAKRRRDIDPLLPGRLTHWRKILHHNQPWGYNTSCVLVLGHMITSFCGNGRPRYEWPERQWHSLPILSRHSTHWSPPEKATSWQLLSLERQTLFITRSGDLAALKQVHCGTGKGCQEGSICH